MWKLGIDVGGTTIKGALFRGEEIVRRGSVQTCGAEGREAILRQLFRLIDELICPEVTFIGVASAGNIDPASGMCLYATDNLKGFTGTPLGALVRSRYGATCRVDNDAVCALAGELSRMKNVKDATMLTLGTGVGGASLVNGKILRGADFSAARWGHVPIVPDGLPCNCGKRGCSEQYLSATALLREGRKVIPGLDSCRQLFELCRSGEKHSVKVVEAFGRHLNFLLDVIETALAPETILIGGGVAKSEDVIRRLIGARFTNVTFAGLGEDAGIYGAALLSEKAV